MTRGQIEAEINALHQLLSHSDYESTQMIESLISTMQDATALNFVTKFLSWLTTTIGKYGDIIRSRAEWRQRLKELEEELENLSE